MKTPHHLRALLIGSLTLLSCGSENAPQNPGPVLVLDNACRVETDGAGAATLECDDGTSLAFPPPGGGATCAVEQRDDAETLEVTCPGGSATVPASSDGRPGCRLEERGCGARYLVCGEDGEVEVRPEPSGGQPVEPTLELVAGATSTGTSDGVGDEVRMDGAISGAFDAAGDFLYFVDTFNVTVRRYEVATRAVVTLAGTPGRKGSADGVGPDASFDGPRGVAVHPDGERVFIADGFNCTIRQLALSTGTVTTLAGSAGSCADDDGPFSDARFRLVIGMAVEPGGRYLYLADRGNDSIRRLDLRDEVVETIAGVSGSSGSADGVGAQARFNGSGGVALSADAGTLYVNDTFNATVRAISLEDRTADAGPARFEVTTIAGAAGRSGGADGVGAEARFDTSQGLARLGDDLYVAGFHNTIRRVDPRTGQVTTVAGADGVMGSADGPAEAARFGTAFGITASPDGRHVYYLDLGNNNIRRFDTIEGQVVTVAGAVGAVGWADGEPGTSRFDTPGQVWVSPDGCSVYTVDSGNHVIRRYDRGARQLETIAGSPGQPGFSDGPGDAARFDFPYGIWVDRQERFAYVTDTGNDAVRRIELGSGEVTTLLGGVAGATSQDGPLSTARLITPAAIVGQGSRADTTRLYVTEADTSTVRLIDLADGTLTTIAGGGPRNPRQVGVDGVGASAEFDVPLGLALDQVRGILYVSEQGHHLLRAVRLEDAAVTTIAGTLDDPGPFDGPGQDASFDNPGQLALFGGVLYVADIGNHAVRRVDVDSGEVTTAFGTLGVAGGSGQPVVPLSEAGLSFPTGVAATYEGLFLTTDEALMFASPTP